MREIIFSTTTTPLSGDTYGLGEVIEVRVKFIADVTVTGSPQLALTIGSATKQAVYRVKHQSGPMGSFRYEVAAGDMDEDGISIATDALSLNGGTIMENADGTTAADLRHDAVPADSSRKVNGGSQVPPSDTRRTAPFQGLLSIASDGS